VAKAHVVVPEVTVHQLAGQRPGAEGGFAGGHPRRQLLGQPRQARLGRGGPPAADPGGGLGGGHDRPGGVQIVGKPRPAPSTGTWMGCNTVWMRLSSSSPTLEAVPAVHDGVVVDEPLDLH
jgi:hypothetical protein